MEIPPIFQQALNDEIDIVDLAKECKHRVNKMFKKLQKSLCNIEIYVTAYITHRDCPEITIYRGSRQINQNLRYDFYEMMLHRENAIEDVDAYQYIDFDMRVELIDPFYGADYVDTLQLEDEIINHRENTMLRKYVYYTSDPDPRKSHVQIMPSEKYEKTFYKKLFVNTEEEVFLAKRLIELLRYRNGESKKFKKIINRLDQKMRFIEKNTTEEHIAFEHEIYERSFYRREWN